MTAGLKSGEPQCDVKQAGDTFAALYADPSRLKQFLSAMTGVSLGAARALAQRFPWQNFQNFVDVGGAQGCVSVQLAHPHLQGGEFDLPVVAPVFAEMSSPSAWASGCGFMRVTFLPTRCRARKC